MMRNLLWIIAAPAICICLPVILMVMIIGLLLVCAWWCTETFIRWLVRKFQAAMEYISLSSLRCVWSYDSRISRR